MSDAACLGRGLYGKSDSVMPLRGAALIRKAGRTLGKESGPILLNDLEAGEVGSNQCDFFLFSLFLSHEF